MQTNNITFDYNTNIMPKSKSQERRLEILNELFRSNKGYHINELIARVGKEVIDYRSQSDSVQDSQGISEKTIRNDIRYLREKHNAPLECIEGKYKYTNPNFTYTGTKLDEDAIHHLNTALAIIQSIPGFELYDEIKDIVKKLEMRHEHIEARRDLIQFDVRESYAGNKYLVSMYEAISAETVISFAYKPFYVDAAKKIILHPYLLKEFNNRWYIVGWSEEAQAIHSYGLERVEGKIKPVGDIIFYKKLSFSANNFFKNVVGITVHDDKPIEKIVLEFTKSRAAFVITNPIHHSQQEIKTLKNHTRFSYDLMINKEFEAAILAYGDDVEVIKPTHLRLQILAKLNNSIQKYS